MLLHPVVKYVPVIRYVYSILDQTIEIQGRVRKISSVIFPKHTKSPAEHIILSRVLWWSISISARDPGTGGNSQRVFRSIILEGWMIARGSLEALSRSHTRRVTETGGIDVRLFCVKIISCLFT